MSETEESVVEEDRYQKCVNEVHALQKWPRSQGVTVNVRGLSEIDRGQWQAESGEVYDVVIPGKTFIATTHEDHRRKQEWKIHLERPYKIIYTSTRYSRVTAFGSFNDYGPLSHTKPETATEVDPLLWTAQLIEKLQTAKKVDKEGIVRS
ncbi:hypothetical protein HYZ78_00720 [Candidatus Microgenomates bacterium]|nr:hypothetical protein [Candidatus Microgenomates bacterium]